MIFNDEIKNKINNNIQKLRNDIYIKNYRIFNDFPIDFYLNDIQSYGEIRNYNYLSLQMVQFFDRMLSSYDSNIVSLYHKLVLVLLMKGSIERVNAKFLPETILHLYKKWFERILLDFSKGLDTFYDHRNDAFLKDMAVCGLRLIPVGGSWLTEISGIGRKFLVGGGVRQFVPALVFALFKARGLRPFFQIHMDSRYLAGFSPQGRDQCYFGLAELLKLNPRIKGMYAVSWFYDPALQSISPNLLYLREEPELNGARVFRIGTSATDIKNATARSATRRQLYYEGKYLPSSYILIWPKRELLTWAHKRRESQ